MRVDSHPEEWTDLAVYGSTVIIVQCGGVLSDVAHHHMVSGHDCQEKGRALTDLRTSTVATELFRRAG